jgi:hypothetical protein
MSAGLASVVLLTTAIYAAIGVAVAVPFLRSGIGRVDPAARGAGLGFKIAVFPGAVALWPCVLRLWSRARGAR